MRVLQRCIHIDYSTSQKKPKESAVMIVGFRLSTTDPETLATLHLVTYPEF